MTQILRPTLVVLGLLAAACTETPENAALSAVQALCSGDEAGFESRLTPDSRRLFEGLSAMDRSRFTCPDHPESLEARPAELPAFTSAEAQPPAGQRIISVTLGSEQLLVGMVERDGAWKVDLFWGEDSPYLPFAPSGGTP
ncbi:MAG: hypothetical protein FJ109_17430 [Deltaproteobacteria bacterium]|nr:hypothetical protein [Deltaproteobacteria bacterium]